MVNSLRSIQMFMFRVAFGLASLFTLLIPVAHANEICPAPSEYRDCFALDLDWTSIAKRKPELASRLGRVQESFTRSAETAQRARVAVATLSDIKKQLEKDESKFDPDAYKIFLAALSEAISWYRAVASGTPAPDDTSVLIGNYDLKTGDAGRAPKDWLMRQHCWSVTEENGEGKCTSEFIKARDLGESVVYVQKVIDKYSIAPRDEALGIVKTREAQWSTYLYATQFQYPWELMHNRNIENKKVVRDDYGNEIGIREAPTSKRILLHPDIGIEYIGNQEKGDRLTPALTFQWYGIQKWDRYAENGVVCLRGISFVTTVADHRNVSSIGHGVMLHFGNYALGITSHSGQMAFTLNLQLADRLATVDNNLKNDIKVFQPK